MQLRFAAGLFLAAGLAGCQSDLTTTPTEPDISADDSGLTSTSSAAPPGSCLTCTFEPRVFTRRTATPVREVIEFPGNPDGAYTIELDDLGGRGGQANIALNGTRIHFASGVLRQDVVLDWDNTLEVRLAGKPGSRLAVRVFQEIASVQMTPATARSRLPATAPFQAVALDRNGVSIPRQTFTWHTPDATIASIDSISGLATTVGPLVDMREWNYKTIRSGVGDAAIIAHADGTDMSATGTWTVTAGFVYSTFQAPRALDDPNRAGRPRAVPFSYDSTRLAAMIVTCNAEADVTAWRPQQPPGVGDRLFQQCYPRLALETPTVHVVFGQEIHGSDSNVGLYGRYCGAGQPDGDWWTLANRRNYQPKDPIDAMCMEHDKSEDLHDLNAFTDALLATCIVKWGIEVEELREDGVLIAPGSARWNAFWSMFPQMAQARAHWLDSTDVACSGLTYSKFLRDRGLERP